MYPFYKNFPFYATKFFKRITLDNISGTLKCIWNAFWLVEVHQNLHEKDHTVWSNEYFALMYFKARYKNPFYIKYYRSNVKMHICKTFGCRVIMRNKKIMKKKSLELRNSFSINYYNISIKKLEKKIIVYIKKVLPAIAGRKR